MTRPETIRAADALARRLHEAGCRYAFGMPGGEVLTLVDALERAGIRFVLARHENAAGFMAEASWHRTGAPAVLVATLGPGVLNGVNVVANALQDRVPLIVIAGCVDADDAQSYTHQVLDQRAVLAPITKLSVTLDAGAAHIVADKAVAVAIEGQPGPVHIDVPISVAAAPVPAHPPSRRAALSRTVPAEPDLEAALTAIRSARRIALIAGVDAVNREAGQAILVAAERLGAPVVTTYKAKGVIPEDHPLCLGGAGLSPKADDVLLPFLDQADLIVGIGYDPIEMRPGWRDFVHAGQQMIDITATPNHHWMHQASVNIVADCAATLEILVASAEPQGRWPSGEIAAVRAKLTEAFPTDDAWGPAAIIDECRTVMPRDTLVTADSGAHRILLSQMWATYAPRDLMQSAGLCTMGCALPLALGAALTSPDRPVLGFSGDAGFLMVAGELATARELGLRPIFVVFVDGSLALIELKQRQRQLENAGVDFAHHDFAAIARAFGGAGHTVTTRAELRAALSAGLEADTFTVIAAKIDRGAYDGRI